MKQIAVPFMQFRGGSSKGVYFHAADLPSCEAERTQVILDAIGRDSTQIDGLGGGTPLTSKVAIVSTSNEQNADIDFLFVQVVVGQNSVDTTPNCGNILAGVGAFAIEAGLIEAQDPITRVKVNMLNTHKLCELEVQTPGGVVNYEGTQRIDGVPGQSAPVICNYLDVAGGVTGALFPTGNLIDSVEGVQVTCVDNGMPVVVLRASALGISGYEEPAALNENQTLKERLEKIRLAIAPKMNIDNADAKAVPKMCIISPAQNGGVINTRTFIPHYCHTSIGVLGAVSVATVCAGRGTVADGLVTLPQAGDQSMIIEHPSGEFAVQLDVEQDEHGKPTTKKAGVIRTTRLLSKGMLYVPAAQEKE